VKWYAGLHARSEFGNDTVPFVQALADIAEMGFAGVMLLWMDGGPVLREGVEATGCFLDLAQCDLRLVRRALDDHGLEAGVVWTAIDLADDPAASRSVERLRRLRDMALELGCRFICHSAGVAEAPGLPLEAKKEGLDRLARVMDAVAAESVGGPVYVAADVHYHGIAESIADCEYLIARLARPNAGPLLNIGHLTTCRQPGWELAERHPDRIRIVGWKDHVLGRPDMPVYSVELGAGDAPLEKYVAVLRPQQVERRHVIAFEHVPTSERKAALARSLRYMQRLWAQTGQA